jgi:SAM-dependent methyltransferase
MKTPWLIRIFAAVALAASFPVWPSLAQVPGLDIHYVPTSTEAVETMLKMAKVTGSDVVYDLGSGDGRIPIAAARLYGARGIGVELDPKLVRLANDNARDAGVADKVTFVQADLFKTDLSKATVVTLYLSPSINLRLRAKLQRELAPGSRVVSNRFPIPDWPPEQQIKVGDQDVFLWTIAQR